MAGGTRKFGKRMTLMATALSLLLAAGVAYAAWTASGSGLGYAKAGSAQALTTVDASASVVNTLVPGGTGDFAVTVSNPNAYPVSVSAVTLNGSVTGSGGTGTCTTTGVTISQAAINATVPFTVPAHSTHTDVVANGASMSNASDDGCQGATFTVPVTLTGTSQ
jgi:hypothetical protein